MTIVSKEQLVTKASEILWGRGVRILQGNKFAATDEAHVAKLADYMEVGKERQIIDMGCGFGEVSRLLQPHSPLAFFWLVNHDKFQLSKCAELHGPYGIVDEDMCATGLPDNLADLVMFNFSLCLVNARAALREAARISNPDGRLFVYDYERTKGDNALTQKHLFADFLTDKEFRRYCAETGWANIEAIYPGGDDATFREVFGNDYIYNQMFRDLIPVIWKARK